MLGTYAAFLAVLGCSAIIGQAVIVACGRRSPSSLAPAVGLAALLPLAWAAVRLPGEGVAAALALVAATLAAGTYLFGRRDELLPAARRALPLVGAGALVASLPFIAEGRFGILGTGLNPDMSQHLFAADRLAAGGSERLISEGYPLGPHSLAVAIAEVGGSLVEAFNGLAIAVAVATCLAAVAALDGLSGRSRLVPALAVGFAYLLAANFVQGAFKEAIEAMFLLAFAVGLGVFTRRRRGDAGRWRLGRAVPLAVLAVGAVYAYSFPGIAWLGGTLAVWAVVELWRTARLEALAGATVRLRAALPAVAVAVGIFIVAVAPEAGRMASFADFETFDPDGEGLGNLFDRLSPLQALGIWPSGDFRVEPGGGALPAAIFYLGSALALAVFAYGLLWWWRRGETAVLSAVSASAALWLYALVAGTPYQEAKALVFLSPLAMLVCVRAVLEMAPDLVEARGILERRSLALLFPGRARLARERLAVGLFGMLFFAGAGVSSALALVNGPVGPSGYSPALAELRTGLPSGSTLVLAPRELLDEQHGRDYLFWELRGNRICVAVPGDFADYPAELDGTFSVELDEEGAVVPTGYYVRPGPPNPPGSCDLITESGRADPAGDE